MTLHLTNQFFRAIQNNPSRCVLLVGAGLSTSGVRKGGKGLPDWDTLIKHMIEDLRDSKRCESDTLSRLEQLLKEEKYLEVAGKFKELTRPDQFAAFLKAELDPPDLAPSEIHEVILKTNFRGIITTNFDCVFEYQNHQLRPLVYPDYLEKTYDFQQYGFFAKIHGCISNTQNLILTEESYDALRSNIKYQFILHSIFFMHTVLTVGFSLRDPDFLGLIDDLRKIFGDNTPTVYALMLDPGQEIRNQWRAKGIEIMPYENHKELLPVFEDMLLRSGQLHPLPTMIPGQLKQAKAPREIRPRSSKHMAKTIAFLSIDQLVARAAIEAKKAELEASGAKTVIINYFAQDTTDFMAYLTKIKYVNPDLLITCLPGKVEQIIQKQILELDGWGAIQILRLDYTAIAPMPTTIVKPLPKPLPAPPKPAGWQELPQDLQATYKINYYFPGNWITMTQPMPTMILALDPTFFPNSELREYDVPAGTTNAQYREIIKNKYPSQNGGEYDVFQVLEQGDITLDDGTQTVYMICKATRMGYTMQVIAVFLVRGTQGFILTGGDYPVTFSDSKALLMQIVKTLHSTILLPPPARTGAVHTELTIDSTIGELLHNPYTKDILDRYIPGFSSNPQVGLARGMTLKQVAHYNPSMFTDEVIKGIEKDLKKISLSPRAPVLESAIHTGLDINSKVGDLMANGYTKAVLEQWIPDTLANPQWSMAYGMTLRQMAPYNTSMFTDEVIKGIEKDLAAIK